MKFSCDVENIHIEIESFNKGSSPRNPKKLCLIDIHIKGTKEDSVLMFVSSGHHMSKKDKKLEKDLPHLIENNELLEHVIHHMELDQSENGPEWRI
jgi:hypothetical protein